MCRVRIVRRGSREGKCPGVFDAASSSARESVRDNHDDGNRNDRHSRHRHAALVVVSIVANSYGLLGLVSLHVARSSHYPCEDWEISMIGSRPK